MNENQDPGDIAFTIMDYLMNNAEYKEGHLILHHGRDMVYCYDMPSLRRELQEIASNVLTKRQKQIPADMGEILDNALEEYAKEVLIAYSKPLPERIYGFGAPR